MILVAELSKIFTLCVHATI